MTPELYGPGLARSASGAGESDSVNTQLVEWWNRLTPDARRRLRQNPFDRVPSDLIAEVTHAGRSPIGATWEGDPLSTEGLFLGREVQQWISERDPID